MKDTAIRKIFGTGRRSRLQAGAPATEGLYEHVMSSLEAWMDDDPEKVLPGISQKVRELIASGLASGKMLSVNTIDSYIQPLLRAWWGTRIGAGKGTAKIMQEVMDGIRQELGIDGIDQLPPERMRDLEEGIERWYDSSTGLFRKSSSLALSGNPARTGLAPFDYGRSYARWISTQG